VIRIIGDYEGWFRINRQSYFDNGAQGLEVAIIPGDRLLELQRSHNSLKDDMTNMLAWYRSCQEEGELRKKSPALQDAWEKYQIIKVLVTEEKK